MEDDQERYLDDAKKVIKEQTYFMNKALQQVNLKDGLRYAAVMLSELKTSLLTPKNYYILFMQIFDEMKVLESYFKEEYRRGRRMMDLYESVQHATNLIPRLYLLITVGSIYIQTHEVGAKKILMDLLDMIKAVQHPLRGLFVRYYFLKMCKERLPDRGSEYEGEGGDINDAIDIIMINLTEMNKLWIRMSGGNKEKPKREKERIDLKVVVGENLLRLSSLEGVNMDVYKETVLPRIIELIISSKDPISQQYLMDCTISTFPDDYHLGTLQELLECCTTKLDIKVDIKTIFIRLMDRLADYAQENETELSGLQGETDIYQMFKINIDRMVDTASSLEFKNVLDLQVAYQKFTLRCYIHNPEYINNILKSCVKICSKQHASDFDDDCLKNIVKFLTQPLESLSLSILTLNEYPNLMKYLPFSKRRQVATKITQAVVNTGKKIESMEIATQFLNFISPLLITEKDYEEIDNFLFAEEQIAVARSLHMIECEDIELELKLINLFFDHFKKGESKRQRYTYPAMFFTFAKIMRKLKNQEISFNVKEFFDKMKSIVEVLAQINPEMALNFYLQFTLIIGEFDPAKEYDEFTYEIACSAMTIYTDEITESEAQSKALELILGSLNQITAVGDDNYETLSTNATQYASKQLKKEAQCLSVLRCTHLFLNQSVNDPDNVIKCLKKCQKLGATCLKSNPKNVYLFIHILNKYLYYIKQQVEVKASDVQECIDSITQNIDVLAKESDSQSQQQVQYWKNTVNYIKQNSQSQDQIFSELKV